MLNLITFNVFQSSLTGVRLNTFDSQTCADYLAALHNLLFILVKGAFTDTVLAPDYKPQTNVDNLTLGGSDRLHPLKS